MLKKLIISFLAFGMLFSGSNVAQAVGIGMDVSLNEERNTGSAYCTRPGTTIRVHRNAYVRWTPAGANAGLILAGARVRVVGSFAQVIGSYTWVQVLILNDAGHNGWAGNTMWVATSQLDPNICR